MLVADLLQRAADQLVDESLEHWTEAELLRWLNDGQREVVRLKPDAYVRHVAHELAAGTLQEIPGDGVAFQRLLRNLGSDGAPGRAITWADVRLFDRMRPDWHTGTAEASARHFLFDPDDPTHFYVWPPQPDPPGKAELVYSAAPPECVSPDDDPDAKVTLPDVYTSALLDYVLYRALMKQGKEAPEQAQAADTYYRRFAAGVGAQLASEESMKPRPRGQER
jgi:hypothetical protein